jgi:allantoin racemase
MKICVIAPVVLQGGPRASLQEFAPAAWPGSQVEVVSLDRGPVSIESEYEDALAAPDIVAKAKAAEVNGFDAVIIDCMLDPGLGAAREQVSIPVVGPAQASMHLAAMLGASFSVITVLQRLVPPLHERARRYGVLDKLASVRAIEIPVLDLEGNPRAAVEPLVEQAVLAVEHDGAHGIVFGCTGMAGLARAVGEGLCQRKYRVPVIDPGIAALKVAETLVSLRLAHSKLTFPTPASKTVVGYPSLG